MSNSFKSSIFQASWILLCSLPMASPSYAVLGGSPMQEATSVKLAPVIHSASESQRSSTASYSVMQTTLPSGTVVREYVSSSGIVFGLAWQGPQPPNLRALLGRYFPQFDSGMRASQASGVRGAAMIDQADLSVRLGGHMGSLVGQAWLPQALPTGVSSADIQ
jgi:hypothetical protein